MCHVAPGKVPSVPLLPTVGGGLTWNNTNGVHSPIDLSLNKGSIRWTENVTLNIQDLPMDQRWACKGQILSSRTGPATLRKPTEGVQA